MTGLSLGSDEIGVTPLASGQPLQELALVCERLKPDAWCCFPTTHPRRNSPDDWCAWLRCWNARCCWPAKLQKWHRTTWQAAW